MARSLVCCQHPPPVHLNQKPWDWQQVLPLRILKALVVREGLCNSQSSAFCLQRYGITGQYRPDPLM